MGTFITGNGVTVQGTDMHVRLLQVATGRHFLSEERGYWLTVGQTDDDGYSFWIHPALPLQCAFDGAVPTLAEDDNAQVDFLCDRMRSGELHFDGDLPGHTVTRLA